MAIDIDNLSSLLCYEHTYQGLSSSDTFELCEKLIQRRALIAATHERLQGMLARIELAQTVDTQQGGKKQCLKAL